MKALLALGLLGLAAADTIKTVQIPTRRGTVQAGTPVAVGILFNFTNRWAKGGGGYFIDLDIGTPPQRVELLLDTGSSDFSQVNGNYASDNIVSGKARLPNFKFAVSDNFATFDKKNKIAHGFLGIGTRGTEPDAYFGCSVPTSNDAMVSAGYIGSNSFSLFLDDKDSPSGSILFGGIDTAKFTGPLITIQAEKDKEPSRQPGQYLHQNVNLFDMTSHSNGTPRQYIPRSLDVPAILDNGASGIHLPSVWYNNLVRDKPVLWNTTRWMRTQMATGPLVYCEDVDTNITLSFTLGHGKTGTTRIGVPFRELLQHAFWPPYNIRKT